MYLHSTALHCFFAVTPTLCMSPVGPLAWQQTLKMSQKNESAYNFELL